MHNVLRLWRILEGNNLGMDLAKTGTYMLSLASDSTSSYTLNSQQGS